MVSGLYNNVANTRALSFIVVSFNKQISCNKKPLQVSFKQSTPTYN